ncbi:dUTP diphosphatase [Methylobacterium sp. WL103]|uniref:dUTP diphosphatase n=1 Tax=Methylobacterium sp. WL103 TaxID=2603891 RepID=UPI0011C813F9|nr:dUTP diphosphatase [Methylobacterium sp. WL103]
MIPVPLKRLTETAIIPTYGSANAAGFDLHADLGKAPFALVHPGEHRLIRTGIAVALPPGFALLICPRSGLSFKSGITVHNGPGVIDADYRGDIGVILHNTTHMQFVVNAGDRIAQGVIVPVFQAAFDEVDTLDETARGTGGFGSTGVAGLPPAAVIGMRAMAQDAADRRRWSNLRPAPGLSESQTKDNGVKWLDAEPEEAAVAMLKAA